MATLLLDMGNSRCKWALTLDGEQVLSTGVWSNQKFDEAIWLSQLKEFSCFPVREIKISSVFKEKRRAMVRAWCEQVFSVSPQFASSQLGYLAPQGRLLANAYKVPEALGVDRWLAMIAACGHTQEAFAVIDAGTAITLDVVDKKGQHLGGHIVPGSRLMQRALLGETGGIQRSVDISQIHSDTGANMDGDFLLGANTGHAVNYGCDLAASSYVIAAMNELWEQKKVTKMLFCGGDGEELRKKVLQSSQSMTAEDCIFVEQLVIEGLLLYKSA